MKRALLLTVCALLLFGAPCVASELPLRDTSPTALLSGLTVVGTMSSAEVELFADADDGQLNHYDLLSATLVASGVSDGAALANYRELFERHATRLRQSGQVVGDEMARARVIFRYLHQAMLTGKYRPECSDMTELFNHGDYNCVSSAVVFNLLAERFELTTVMAETTGHAISRLIVNGDMVNVETTCPTWFDGDYHRAVLSKEKSYRPLSSVGVVSVIYYNRGYEALSNRRFDEAVVLNVKSLRLNAQSGLAQGNYLAAINNWSIARCEAGELLEAEQMLRFGLTLAPNYVAFADNLRAVHERLQKQNKSH